MSGLRDSGPVPVRRYWALADDPDDKACPSQAPWDSPESEGVHVLTTAFSGPVARRLVIRIHLSTCRPGIPSERCAWTPIPLIRTPMAMPLAWPVTWQAARSIRPFGAWSRFEQARSTDAPSVSDCIRILPDTPMSHRRLEPLARWREAPEFSTKERAVLAFTRGVVPDGRWEPSE